MPTEDRRIGKLLPSPVTPPDTVCFTITIPNAVQYRAAFLGQINVLGQALTWDHPTDGTDCLPCEEAAQLWRNAIYNAVWSNECGEDMSCQDVADCIENDQAVQDAIAEQINNNVNIQNNVYTQAYQGAPMTDAQATGAVVYGPACNYDSLFGSVTAIIDQMDRNNRDFLEIIKVGANTRERVSLLLKAIPLFETLPIDEGIDYINKLQEEILENYEAQWTDALRDEYRCALFCLAKDKPECQLSFDDVFEYYNTRLGANLEPENLFNSLSQYFITGTWSGSTVVDIMMLTQLGVWRAASNWLGTSLRSFQTVGLLGSDDLNPDWVLLCEDCPEPPPTNLQLVNIDTTWSPEPVYLYTNSNGDVWQIEGYPQTGSDYNNITSVRDVDNRCFYVKAIQVIGGSFVFYYQLNCGGGVMTSTTITDMIGVNIRDIRCYGTGGARIKIRVTIALVP